MIQVADGVFCETGWEGANVSAIVTGEGVVLVDSPMLPRDAREWKRQLSKVSDKPPIFLINTDYHFDHMMTDCLLCDRVVAHMLAEPAFAAQDAGVFTQMVSVFFPDIDAELRREVEELKPVSPFLAFSQTLAFNLGSKRIEIMHMGGHTPATSVVYLPDDAILLTGDVHVHDRHPFPGDADLVQWIDALGQIEKMDVMRIVPGHGEVCDLKSVSRLKRYFEEMRERVLDLIRQGYDREQVEELADMLSYFPVEKGKEARTQSFIRLGVGRMYAQLKELAAGNV